MVDGVLIDTSVWVSHFRRRNPELVSLLSIDQALTHPFVLGELACGTPPAPRAQTLTDLGLLPQIQQASLQEIATFIEYERLYGLGCGLIDISLLASALLSSGIKLWTLDKHLSKLARRFGIQH